MAQTFLSAGSRDIPVPCIETGPWLFAALVFGLLLLPLSGTFKCAEGWPRTVMMIYTGVLGLIGVGTLARFFFLDARNRKTAQTWLDLERTLLGTLVIGVIASTWLVNFLVFKQPRR